MAITLSCPDEFAAHYIANGDVKIEGFDVQPIWPDGPGGAVYVSAFNEPMYDIMALPVSNFLIAMDKGLGYTGIPVFLDMFFPQLGARVRKGAGISGPAGLEGKRVGIRGYGFNPSVWLRGALAENHGVDLKSITWVCFEPNSLSAANVPHGDFTVEMSTDTPEAMLERGDLDVIFYDRSGPPLTEHTEYLFADALGEAARYHLLTGVFPPNIVLLAKQSLLDANPGLGQAVVDASDKARERYYAAITDEDDHMGLPVKWLRQNGLFPHYNGLENNRTSLAAGARYAHELGIVSRLYEPEELFFEGAR